MIVVAVAVVVCGGAVIDDVDCVVAVDADGDDGDDDDDVVDNAGNVNVVVDVVVVDYGAVVAIGCGNA